MLEMIEILWENTKSKWVFSFQSFEVDKAKKRNGLILFPFFLKKQSDKTELGFSLQYP